MSQYDDRVIPLVMGELYGIRSFRVKSDGSLAPLHQGGDLVYAPGVHTAVCDSTVVNLSFRGGKFSWDVVRETDLHAGKPAPVKYCTCGFYAYFADAPDNTQITWSGSRRVNGVVRATGRCIVGEYGFRAEKMEIVGLVADKPDTSWKARVLEFFDDLGEKYTKTAWWPIVAVWVIMMLALIARDVWPDIEAFKLVHQSTQLLIYSYGMVMIAAMTSDIGRLRREVRTAHVDPMHAKPPRATSNKIRAKFPDVDYFEDLNEAKKHYPVSKASDLPS